MYIELKYFLYTYLIFNIISHVSPDLPLGTSDHVVIHFEVIVTVDSQCNVHGFCTYNWPLADYEAIEL